MEDEFKEQSWIMVLILTVITFGIYLPFWFKKIKKVTDTFQTEKKLNGNLITFLIIISFLIPLFSITITVGTWVYTTNYYGIGDILNLIRVVGVIFLAFSLKKILENKYSVKIDSVLTFFLSALYLQDKINNLIKKTPDKPITTQQQ